MKNPPDARTSEHATASTTPESDRPMNQDDLTSQLAELHPACWAWALVCCKRDPHEAEDVLQDAYIKLMTGRARFEGRSSFKTFLFSVVRTTAYERRRKRMKRSLLLGEWFGPSERAAASSTPAPQPHLVDGSRQRALVLDALSTLSDRQREILELVFYHDLSIEEAASVLDMKLGTARTHYARGKKRMLEILDLSLIHI